VTCPTIFWYYHADQLGSSNILTDSSGAVVQHREYSAFGGSTHTDTTCAFDISNQYTGQILDEDTGLYYYGARYYDPGIGRFTQPDPSVPHPGSSQSFNRYSYVRNNPLKGVDPTGLDDTSLFDVPSFPSFDWSGGGFSSFMPDFAFQDPGFSNFGTSFGSGFDSSFPSMGGSVDPTTFGSGVVDYAPFPDISYGGNSLPTDQSTYEQASWQDLYNSQVMETQQNQAWQNLSGSQRLAATFLPFLNDLESGANKFSDGKYLSGASSLVQAGFPLVSS
jgi:RHS repeat-associated protein